MSDSDANSTSNTEEVTPPKRRRIQIKKRIQSYRTEWEKKFHFLRPVKDKVHMAYCSCCKTEMKADISVIKNHQKGQKHEKNLKVLDVKIQSRLDSVFISNSNQDPIKRAETKIAAFVAEHNIPFLAIDHLTLLLKDIFPDSKIAQGLNLGRTKCSKLTSNVIGKIHKEELVQRLKTNKFSILIDESTDIGSVKTMCICVRYYSDSHSKIISEFYELIQLFSASDVEGAHKGANAERLYEVMIDTFKNRDIPDENIIGFGSDGCNTMMGAVNSVASRLRKHYPGIFISKCICHSLHLCASEACKVLPRMCEDMARDIYNYFKSSHKRQAQLTEFQTFCKVEPHKLLHPSQTRWLSLLMVVERILEQWQPLKLYFTSKVANERLHACGNILTALNSDVNYLYYLFLEWVLPKFVKLNQFFQSEKVVIADLYIKMSDSYRDLLLSYLDRNYVFQNKLNDISPHNTEKYININNLYLGIRVRENISKVTQSDQIDFLKTCREFLIISCLEIKKRFNFEDEILNNIHVLHPKYHKKTETLFDLIKAVPRITANMSAIEKQTIDDEWRMFQLETLPDYITNITDVDVYWAKIKDLTNADGTNPYRNVAIFVLNILVYPHSNATCERLFSKVNLIKTDLRNRLITPTINGLLLASQEVKNQVNCHSFEPSKKMLNSITKSNLYNDTNDNIITSESEVEATVIFDL